MLSLQKSLSAPPVSHAYGSDLRVAGFSFGVKSVGLMLLMLLWVWGLMGWGSGFRAGVVWGLVFMGQGFGLGVWALGFWFCHKI